MSKSGLRVWDIFKTKSLLFEIASMLKIDFLVFYLL